MNQGKFRFDKLIKQYKGDWHYLIFILIAMLQPIKLFLPFNLIAQFLLGRHIEHIFRGE